MNESSYHYGGTVVKKEHERFPDVLRLRKQSENIAIVSSEWKLELIDRQINTISSEKQAGCEALLLLVRVGRTQRSLLNATLQVAQELDSNANEPQEHEGLLYFLVPTSL